MQTRWTNTLALLFGHTYSGLCRWLSWIEDLLSKLLFHIQSWCSTGMCTVSVNYLRCVFPILYATCMYFNSKVSKCLIIPCVQSTPMLQYLERKMFQWVPLSCFVADQLQCDSLTCDSHRNAYDVACLGVTENDWMVLALEAFEVGWAVQCTVLELLHSSDTFIGLARANYGSCVAL